MPGRVKVMTQLPAVQQHTPTVTLAHQLNKNMPL